MAGTAGEGRKRLLLSLAVRQANLVFTLAVTFLGLTAVTFVIGRLMPSDPVLAIVGDRASKEVYDAVYTQLGLDRPILAQYWIYLSSILRGEFGNSIMTTRPVLEDLLLYFPATIELATVATLIGVILGVPLGIAAAVYQGRVVDHLARLVGLFGYSAPVFWLGMVALLVFYAELHWLPGPGRLAIGYEGLVDSVSGFVLIDSALQGQWDALRSAASHLVLPAVVLGLHALAYIARMTRSFMLDQLKQEYITTARVKGLSETAVIIKHAFRNVLIQLITIIGLTYASLLEGSVLTETVFAWPGIGQYITNSLFNADMNAVLGATILVGTCFVAINKVSDLLYRLVDPRVRQ